MDEGSLDVLAPTVFIKLLGTSSLVPIESVLASYMTQNLINEVTILQIILGGQHK